MKHQGLRVGLFLISLSLLLGVSGCSRAHGDPAAEAPPPADVVSGGDVSLLTVDHPEQYPVVAAVERASASELVVTGTVSPDVSGKGGQRSGDDGRAGRL